MSAITIRDLTASRELDREAMSRIKGGGAPWVYGWIQTPSTGGSFGTVVNFYQVNNYADQMINQYQNVKIDNTGNNSNINVDLGQNGGNLQQQ